MSYREVMDLPIRAFWMMNSMIGRVVAERDIRSMAVDLAAQSQEGFQQKMEALREEMGQMYIAAQEPVLEAKPEEGAFDKLRELS